MRAYFIPLAPAGFPLQGFSFPGSRIASRRPLPSCRYRRPASRFQVTKRRPAFRALLPLGTTTPTRLAVKRSGVWSLLGVLPLQGLPSLGRGSPFSAPPLTSFDARRSGRRASAPQGVSEPGEWQSLATPPPLLRFLASSTFSPIWKRHRTWLIFSPQTRRRVATTPAVLFGPCWLPT